MRQFVTTHFTVIARLDRAIQYAAPFRFNHEHLRLLDAPPSRGMTVSAGMTTISSEDHPHERAA
jgi:hypothetical protein